MSPDTQASPLRALFLAGLIVTALFTDTSTGPATLSRSTSHAQQKRIVENGGEPPVGFKANRGQAEKRVKFLSRGGSYGLYLTGNEAALILNKTAFGKARPDFQRERSAVRQSVVSDILRMYLAGATDKADPVGEEQLPSTINYFIGSDPAKWRTGVPIYAKVRYYVFGISSVSNCLPQPG